VDRFGCAYWQSDVLDAPVAPPSRLRLSCRLQEGRQRYGSRGVAEPEVKRRGVRCVGRLVQEGRVAGAGARACPGDSRATRERVRWRRMGRVLPVGVMLPRGGEVRSSAVFVLESAVE
jgi:hypothetical protein